jgi:hypothetical protein
MRNSRFIIISVINCFIVLNFSLAKTIDFYVAIDGNDKNDGTKKTPFATLEKARDSIRQIKEEKTFFADRVTVWIREGEYVVDKTFELNEKDSGNENCPIKYSSYKKEKVSILGGQKIDPKAFKIVIDPNILRRIPVETQGKLFQADLKRMGITNYGQHRQFGHALSVVEAPMELFFNDKVMPLARYPNKGGILIGKIIDTGSIPRDRDYSERGGVFEYTDIRHERWVDAKDIWFQGEFKWGFADDKIKVEWIDPIKKQVKLASPHMYGIDTGTAFRKYTALNLLEEIDEPGEWYIERDKGILFFWPPESLDKVKIKVSILEEPIIAMEGASYVNLNNITVEIGRGIGIYIERCDHVLIAGCTVRNVGTSGIFMGQGSKQTFPHITHDDYEGIPISRHIGNLQGQLYTDVIWDRKAGNNNGIMSCDIYDTGCGGIYLSGGSKKELIAGHNYVQNCRIHDYNRRNKFLWAGINVDGCGNLVANNEIYNSDFQGIYVHGNEHIFEYNNIHHVALDSDDTSAWYLGRDPSDRGNIIRYNFFHHVGRLDRMVMGVYFDDATCGVTVHGNVFYKMQTNHGVVFSNSGHDLVVHNNIFADCGGAAVELNSMWYNWANNKTEIDELFGLYEKRLTRLIDIKRPPYSIRYPVLIDWLDAADDVNCTYNEPKYNGAVRIGMRPRRNLMKNNLIYKCPQKLKITGQFGQFEEKDNFVIEKDPGFVDETKLNFQLKEDSVIYKRIPNFQKIPFEKIGLYKDEYRSSNLKHVQF